MTLRPLRFSLLFLTILLAAACSGGDDGSSATGAGELPLDDSGLIATFDVGYDVPLDVPEEIQDPTTEQDEDDGDPPDGLAMSDDGSEADADAMKTDGEGEDAAEDARPDDQNRRDDGLIYVRSEVRDDGQWNSISLLAPDGEVVWSYGKCDELGCTHDDILVLPNGNVAVTATAMVDEQWVDNVLELEPVIGEACASDEFCTGIARQSRLHVQVPDGTSGAVTLINVADDYNSWDVLSLIDGSTWTIPAR